MARYLSAKGTEAMCMNLSASESWNISMRISTCDLLTEVNWESEIVNNMPPNSNWKTKNYTKYQHQSSHVYETYI